PGAPTLLFLASMAIAGGLVGLGLLSRRVKAEQERTGAVDEADLHIYRQVPCRIDRALLERWLQAEEVLRQRLQEPNWPTDRAAYQPHHDKAEKLRQAGDLVGAFAETCRAMQRLVRAIHEHRPRSEVFQPVWDK